jgi:hypothetical protein
LQRAASELDLSRAEELWSQVDAALGRKHRGVGGLKGVHVEDIVAEVSEKPEEAQQEKEATDEQGAEIDDGRPLVAFFRDPAPENLAKAVLERGSGPVATGNDVADRPLPKLLQDTSVHPLLPSEPLLIDDPRDVGHDSMEAARGDMVDPHRHNGTEQAHLPKHDSLQLCRAGCDHSPRNGGAETQDVDTGPTRALGVLHFAAHTPSDKDSGIHDALDANKIDQQAVCRLMPILMCEELPHAYAVLARDPVDAGRAAAACRRLLTGQGILQGPVLGIGVSETLGQAGSRNMHADPATLEERAERHHAQCGYAETIRRILGAEGHPQHTSHLATEHRNFRETEALVHPPTTSELTKMFGGLLLGSVDMHASTSVADASSLKLREAACWNALLLAETEEQGSRQMARSQGEYPYESRLGATQNSSGTRGRVRQAWERLCTEGLGTMAMRSRPTADQDLKRMFQSPLDMARQSRLFQFLGAAAAAAKAAEAMASAERQLQKAAHIRCVNALSADHDADCHAWQRCQIVAAQWVRKWWNMFARIQKLLESLDLRSTVI